MAVRPIFEAVESRVLFASVPSGFIDQTLITGLTRATSMRVLPDGRWLVTEQSGKVRMVKNGTLLSTAALTLKVDSQGERGVLGLDADPNFASNHFIYVYYTPPASNGVSANRVSRFTMSGDTVVSGSEKVLMNLSPLTPGVNTHNSGALHFGKDGKLYITTGDNATPERAQSLQTLHGKMLRINPDGSIPTDNPFYNKLSGNLRAIWAYGLRNPFTFAVHPVDGTIYINDVGQDTYEEIDKGRAGANYGWPVSEGPTSDPTFDAPIHYYGRAVGEVITGGVFYAGGQQQFPSSYANDYFFADFDTGWIKALDSQTKQAYSFATGTTQIVDLDVLADGSLLYLSRQTGIGRIRYSPNTPATITRQPADLSVAQGQAATFSVDATGQQPLKYQWYRNGTAISGATQATYTLTAPKSTDSGALFSVRVSNALGGQTSRQAKLTVNSNTAPTPTIVNPTSGTTFGGGQVIKFSGTATDKEDGTLPASAYKWTIEYVTGSVVRPFQDTSGVTSGQFTPPTITPFTESDVKFRITLTVTDKGGAKTSVMREIFPRTSKLNLSSSGNAVPINVDGQPKASPATIVSVEGVQRTIDAPQTYALSGVTYTFQKWSDGGARSRTISTPLNDLTLVATYTSSDTQSSGTAQISGYVVNDTNHNGQWSHGELGLAGRTVWIDLDHDSQQDSNETVLTDKNGRYLFTNLAAGTYVIRQVLPAGWVQSSPTVGTGRSVTVNNGQVASAQNFATYQTA